MSAYANRRRFLFVASGAMVGVVGCGSNTIEETIENAPTPTLENTRLALRGLEIVSMIVGGRVIQLPYPATRILGVVLMATAVATKLVVEYFDEELRERRIEEQISDAERTTTESKNSVEFLTSNGSSERVYLGPTDYSQP